MKLYAENGTVYFDYTDVPDVNAGLDGKAIDWRRFMRETQCWDVTSKKQILKLAYKPWAYATEYGNVCELVNLIGRCEFEAKNNNVEIDNSFNEFYNATINRRKELCEIEKEKAEKLLAEAEAKGKWESLCKYGCGSCENKCRCGDDFICIATGELLEEKNAPKSWGGIHYLFNYTAFPTENCPFNINKNKETNYVQEGTKKAS